MRKGFRPVECPICGNSEEGFFEVEGSDNLWECMFCGEEFTVSEYENYIEELKSEEEINKYLELQEYNIESLSDHICSNNLCEECGEVEITCECLVCGKELCEFCFNNYHFCEKKD